jgi:signal transduction histidine kinase
MNIERESARLAALDRYDILDSPPEDAFEAIVRLAAQVCGTPVALITLVDEARQWFKARVGWDVNELPREIAFCHHAIQGTEVCLVPDALTDERFRGNPLVLRDPYIRFYAGMPVVTSDGFALGTLCVIDYQPRDALSSQQLTCLELLAQETMTQLELRKALAETAEAKAALSDANLELEAFGGAMAHDLRAPLRHIDAFASMLAEHSSEDASAQRRVADIRRACRRALDTIDSLLRLSRASQCDLRLERVDLSAMVRDLTTALCSLEPARNVEFVVPTGIEAHSDASLLRLVLDNLLANAWKFTSKQERTRIEFGARRIDDARLEYFVRDNGVGFDPTRALLPPKPFARQHSADTYEGIGLGLTIVNRAVRRLGGSLRAESQPGSGATFFFTLGSLRRNKRRS